MTKSQMLSALAEKTGLSKKDVANFMDSLTEMAYEEVRGPGEFVIPGIGKLVKRTEKQEWGAIRLLAKRSKSRLRRWLNSECLSLLKMLFSSLPR